MAAVDKALKMNKSFPGFRVGVSGPLEPADYRRILSDLVKGPGRGNHSSLPGGHVLGGRTSVRLFDIPGKGAVVVKPFLRGGLFRIFVRDRYFRAWGKSRAHLEFAMLSLAREKGIKVPEPLGVVEQGRFWYRCWLVTRQIPQAKTLAALSLADEKKTGQIMPRVMEQVDLLVKHKLVHADLHPGNVLIGQDEGVFLIDFDKACPKCLSSSSLFGRYRKRWDRAVAKHGLPRLLSRLFVLPWAGQSRYS